MTKKVKCHKGKCKYEEVSLDEEIEEVKNNSSIVDQIEEDLLKEALSE